jgi:alkanesulfonate monooxygenase SsuD/methylene tetrahydromethanopterin reductase-like flavin-dependent oxidoreductase (luciferase family)
MRYGFVLPYGDARTAVDAAVAAEAAGWDGFFVWEPVWGYDAWVCLTAAAMATERIKLGTMLTPIARMRPWKLASETATLDNLSGGRVILAVGLGAPDSGYVPFGEETDRRIRAELTDEGLAILTGLWAGQPFSFKGKHYTVTPTDFPPPAPPLQQPRIPIWVVGALGRAKSMERALRYDGLLPNVIDENGTRAPTLAELATLAAEIKASRPADQPYDLIIEGETPGDDPVAAAAQVQPWIEHGGTWWIESLWSAPRNAEGRAMAMRRIEQGPPRSRTART